MDSSPIPSEAEIQRTFERERLIFEQDCEDFRSLNAILWQVPVIVSTLTGGLWFGVTLVEDDAFVASALFLLAAVANVSFVIVLWRLRRGVMETILQRIRAFQGSPADTNGRYKVIKVFSFLLLFSAGISLLGVAMKALPLVCRWQATP